MRHNSDPAVVSSPEFQNRFDGIGGRCKRSAEALRENAGPYPFEAITREEAMRERKRHIRIAAGAVIFFVIFCIVGSAVGIWINSHYYAMEMKSAE